ncbi:hypothetical protein KPH14_008390 [Odynerus spinipes]|uniref:Endonuclease/exonuclease/phosphatase domain-containing protein n=1 Tax=Odynerus spinipes TaxID=1348599 RepID=A0AAD9VU26_9HYME|nr:hypothetical protein KPH14_008390 [Odynerus spinipes]
MTFIIQWNINGYFRHLEQLKLIIHEYSPLIIWIQETNFKIRDVINLKDYTEYSKIRNTEQASGGVSMFVHNSLEFETVQLVSDVEAIAICISFPIKACICNIYAPNSRNLEIDELTDLYNQLSKPLIMLGDFNSHSSMWGSYKKDKRGKIIEKMSDVTNIALLNDLSPIQFNISNGTSSAIDLSLCSPQLMPKLSWVTLDSLYDSDHYPISITIPEQRTSYNTYNSSPNISGTSKKLIGKNLLLVSPKTLRN